MKRSDQAQRRAEAKRIRLLRSLDILDTMREGFSDAIALAAASIANTPMSALSLVDTDRQWFKASCGLAIEGTARAISFCAHSLDRPEPLIVADALEDERFATNPMVTGSPHIRFYAGFPLIVQGHAVGTLCIIDDRVRQLTSPQIEQLTSLAAGAAAWLGRRAGT